MPRRLFVFAALAAAVLGCGQGGPPGGPGGPPGPQGPPLVTAAKPVVKTVTQFTDVTGTLKAVKRVEVRPQVGGYIKQVHFKDGADVKQGDLLVTIDPALYTADLNKAKGDLQNAQAQSKLAVADAARFSRLRATGAVTQEELDRADAQVAISAANIASNRAAIERAEVNLAYTKITSPITGRVDRILVNEGNLIAVGGAAAASTVLTVLTSVDPIYAYFDLDEQTVQYYLKLINAGQIRSVRDGRIPIEFRMKGEAGYPHRGEMEFAATELNATTGSLQVRAEVPNPAPYQFLPGLFVRARLPGARVPDAVLIPDSAVSVDQDRKIVYVVTADNKVSVRPVEVGPLSDGLRVVLKGVTKDDRVIIRGQQRVQDGVPVEVEAGEIKPDAPPAG